jgi:hypothetical protein
MGSRDGVEHGPESHAIDGRALPIPIREASALEFQGLLTDALLRRCERPMKPFLALDSLVPLASRPEA